MRISGFEMGNCIDKRSVSNKVSPGANHDDGNGGSLKGHIDEYKTNIKIARSHKRMGDIDCALVHFQRCLEISKIYKKSFMEIESLSELGVAYYELREYDRALEYFIKMYECSKNVVDHNGIRAATVNLAAVYELTGNNQNAIEMYNEHIRVCSERGCSAEAIMIHYDVALVCQNIGEIESACEHLTKALELASTHGKSQEKLTVCTLLSQLSYDKGKVEDALQYRDEELRAAKQLNACTDMQRIHKEMGGIFIELKNYTSAEYHYNEALRFAKKVGDKQTLAMAHEKMSALYKAMKKKGDAKYHRTKANKIRSHAV